MVRRNVCPGMAFSNGMYIFDKNRVQICPTEPEGQILESILVRQIEDTVDSLPQKHKAEVDHNIDINKDGHIGKPEIVEAEIEITPESITIKPKKRKSKKVSLPALDSSDVAVDDSNNTVPV